MGSEAGALERGRLHTGASPTARRILLVEDDETWGETLGRVLRDAGFDVEVTRDFGPALEALGGATPIDLLIADIVMPTSVNGVALSRMARMRQRDIKVIYVTGYDIPGIENETLGPVLRKPITGEELIAEVERVLAAS